MKTKTFLKTLLFSAVLLPMAAWADAETGAGLKYIGVVVGAGIAGMGAAIGIGMLAGKLLEGIARQPEMEAKLLGRFFLAVGLTDAVPIIAIAVALLVLFAY